MNELYGIVRKYLELSGLASDEIGPLMGHSTAYFSVALQDLKRGREMHLQKLTDLADFFDIGFENKHVRPFVFSRDGVQIPWMRKDKSNPLRYYTRVLGLELSERTCPPPTSTIKRQASENDLEVSFLVTVDVEPPLID